MLKLWVFLLAVNYMPALVANSFSLKNRLWCSLAYPIPSLISTRTDTAFLVFDSKWFLRLEKKRNFYWWTVYAYCV